MQTVSNVTFENETVCMDDRHFADCVIDNCVLEYSGKELTMERTEIRGCRLKLTEGAGRTLLFLRCMGYMEDLCGPVAPIHEDVRIEWNPTVKPN